MNIYSLSSLIHTNHLDSNESENEKIYFLKEEQKKLKELKLKSKENLKDINAEENLDKKAA